MTLGADNVFDVYPGPEQQQRQHLDPTGARTAVTSNFGIFPYNGISPFGFNGRFVYTRLAVAF